ncbi:MAG TPA: ABC transporter substrate-binding protein [Nitriliruptorales bacterium]
MNLRVAAGLAAAAVVVAACGSTVPPEVWDQLAAEAGRGPEGEQTGGPAAPGVGPGDPVAAPDGSATDDPGTAGPGVAGPGAQPTTGTGTGGTGGTGGGTTGNTGNTKPNYPSDVGVTENSIKVGLLFSRSGPLGPLAFAPGAEGALAYFNWLNTQGGINGRLVEVVQCDDAEDPERNRQCANFFVNEEQVFALVATYTRAYAGASIVSNAGVPDVGGQPIGNEYTTWPTLFSIRGSEYPRTGEVGYQGNLWSQGLQFRWAKQNLGVTHVGVVFYDIPASESFATFIQNAAPSEGLDVTGYRVNAAFPNFDSVASQMVADGVDGVWDTLDATGNQKLCEALERKSVPMKGKLTTTQGMTRRVDQFPQYCKDVLHVWGESRPNSDTSHPEVKLFRDVIRQTYGQEYDDNLHQWALEGWSAAKIFSDAAASLGADLTREGLMDVLDGFERSNDPSIPLSRLETVDGLLSPIHWRRIPYDKAGNNQRECLVISKWDQSIRNFRAVTPFPFCDRGLSWIAYEPAT